jgi:hypothetical protein
VGSPAVAIASYEQSSRIRDVLCNEERVLYASIVERKLSRLIFSLLQERFVK